MPWKDYLKMIVLFAIAISYSLLKYAFPDFPLGEEIFTALIVWIICAFGGGWIVGKVYGMRKIFDPRYKPHK